MPPDSSQASQRSLEALADLTDAAARRYAHAAVLAALEGDQGGLAQDFLDGADRKGLTPEVVRYLVVLSGSLIGSWAGAQLSPGQVVGFARHYFASIEKGTSHG